MADQKQNTTPQIGNPQASSNTFSKGMFKDYNETFIGEGLYTHARNGVNNSHDGQVGVIGNEPSNLKCITLPATMIGCIHLLDDQWLIYSTNNFNSYVGIFDESACTYEPLKNKNGDEINFSCLNLQTTNLITGVFRKRYDCERLVYWDDSLNPTRTMDIDNVPCLQDCGASTTTCKICIDTIYVDCEKIRIAPIVDHPCLTLSKGKLPGTLPNGSYQACIAYTIGELRVTDYIGLTEVQGLWSHENTSSSLDIHISHIDSSFNEFELVIVSNINAQTVAKRIGYYNTSRGDIHVDRWDTETVNIPVGDVVFRSEPIEKSDAMYTVNNYLLRIGTYSKFKFNYQPLANKITANWLSVEYPKNYYQKAGNNIGYMRDEVYAFFIRFVYNTGEFSESYHIPGRPANSNDTITVNGQDVYDAVSSPTWKVYNTATLNGGFNSYSTNDGGIVIAQGSMSYWESDETYPSDKPEIWNSDPRNPGSLYNLCGQPIRHHKMPDETVNSSLNLYNSVNDRIRLLGVKFDNIQPPVDNQGNIIQTILGYEILRGSREGNKTIIAKGLINNMREYSIPNSSNKGLFVNYPYNDLHDDGYLFDANSGVSRPTGYNGAFWGTNYTSQKMKADTVKDKFSFHSPDTTFSKPYINAAELKLYNEHVGTSTGSFEAPYKSPKFKAPSTFIGLITNLVTIINTIDTVSKFVSGEGEVHFTGTEAVPLDFTYKFPKFPTLPSNSGSDAYGVTAWLVIAFDYTLWVLEIIVWAFIIGALLILTAALNDAKVQKIYDIYYALIPTRQYAAQCTSHGFYNNYASINRGNMRRSITLANYIGSGVQQFGITNQINNIDRGNGDIAIQLGNVILPTTKDNSRATCGEAHVGYNELFTRTIASYYGALKIPMASQYGQIESIKQIPVTTCINSIASTSTGKDPLFGGDVYLNRFTQKNTMFFFNTWLLGELDEYEFNYCNYINIPYPRWWYNSELWRVRLGSAPAEQRSLDRTNETGGVSINGSGATLYVNTGYFYLFNSGVRDFFVESEVNVAYRDYEDNDITKRFYDPYGFASITGETSMFRSDSNIITAPNYYKYDYALSKSKLFNSSISWGNTLPRDYNPVVAETCYVYRPNRVIYSLPQQDNSKKDNWRAFLTNNFKDFSSKVSCIKPIHKTGALFMMKYANPQMFMGVEELKLSDSGTKVTIGDGALFSSGGVSQLQSVVNSDESYEYGSNQGRFCAINCIHGVFWVSQNQGKVFNYGGSSGIEEISAGGMRWWFAKYLPSQLLKQWSNYPLYDNPVAGIGVQMIYDNTHDLIYITKKDYIPKPGSNCEQQLNYNGKFVSKIPVAPDSCPPGSSLQNGVCVPDIPQCPEGYTYDAAQNLCVTSNMETVAPTYTAFAAKKNVQVVPASFDNTDCWEECSWTISYDPKIKAWVSFHDWIPSFLIPGRSHFMSVAPESGSIVDSIWKHNIRCDSYCNYYGVDYPFEIEFVSATGQTVNSMRSIEYLLEAYNYSNDCRDKFHNYYENFDQAIVYNSEQISGLLMLNLHTKNDPLNLLAYPRINTALGYIDIQYAKVENKFRFNQFWDITNDRGQALPSPLNIPMFNTECNGYKYPINPAYVNYSKPPLERKKFRHNVNRVFLRRLVSGSNKFLFKISNQKNLQSPR
jgi:hypothetical protein